jgi:hypothetical protein
MEKKKNFEILNNSKILFKIFELKGNKVLNNEEVIKKMYELNLGKKFSNRRNIVNRIIKDNNNFDFIKDKLLIVKYKEFLIKLKGNNRNYFYNNINIDDIKIKEL